MKKKFMIILMLIVVIIMGITLAVYTYATYDETIDAESNCFSIVYTKGQDIGSNENLKKLNIGITYTDGLSTTVKIKTDSSCNNTKGIGVLYLITSEETSDYLIDNNLLNYYVMEGSTNVSSGVVTNKGESIIYENFDITTTEKSITVYIWISGENITEDNLSEVIKTTYKGSISISAESR